MVFIITIHEILQDSTTLEDVNIGPVRPFICNRGKSAVGINLEEPGLFVLVDADVDNADLSVRGEELLLVNF